MPPPEERLLVEANRDRLEAWREAAPAAWERDDPDLAGG